MTINIYYHERCSECGNIRRALKHYDIQYRGHYFPPENPDLNVSPEKPDSNSHESNIFEPVLIHEKNAPDGIIGHEQILKWIEETYSN